MEKLEVNKFLPFGASLREVLMHPSLTGTNLKYLLRQRGIFIESTNDSDTMSLLSSTILSPLEFEFIVDKLKSKEDNSKMMTRNIKWNSRETLIKAVPAKLNLKDLFQESNPRFKILSQTNFAPVEGNPDKVKMVFKCETNNYNSSWYRTKNEFSGEVVLEKVEEEGKVYMKMVYTSPETFNVSDKVVKHLEKHFKENNLSEKNAESERILYKNFSNEERVKFFLSLIESSGIFEFIRVTDLNIGPDPTEELPKEFSKFMSGVVKELKIKGENLHHNFFIKEFENHKYVEMAEIEAIYNFKYNDAEGSCKVRFGFVGYLKKRLSNIEFSTSVETPVLKDEHANLNKEKIRVFLLQEFEKFKDKMYNAIKYPISIQPLD